MYHDAEIQRDHTDSRSHYLGSELDKEFSFNRIHKSGAVFDIEKLKWMNRQYLMKLPLEQVAKKVKPFFDKYKFLIFKQSYKN